MKRIVLVLLLLAAAIHPALAALNEGDVAPDFFARASLAGKEFDFSLKQALKKGVVVVYFYPSAYTGGCNKQAHEFSVDREKFDAAGASVIGVSLDSIDRLNRFSADPDYCAGKVAVASDADGSIAKAYGLSVSSARSGMKDTRGDEIDHGFAERTTFIVTPDGRIAAVLGGLEPAVNVQKALEFVQRLSARKAD
ncbi:MAG: peroxiredoxin [Gallionellaceae bacterium]|jgi:peroxiredoxin|nr:peroxiredoxin [Gallionellaceae bacterium]